MHTRSAAASAIQDANIITAAEQDLIDIHFPYSMMNEVMKILREENMRITGQEFGDTCHTRALIRKSQTARVLKKLSALQETSAGKL